MLSEATGLDVGEPDIIALAERGLTSVVDHYKDLAAAGSKRSRP